MGVQKGDCVLTPLPPTLIMSTQFSKVIYKPDTQSTDEFMVFVDLEEVSAVSG